MAGNLSGRAKLLIVCFVMLFTGLGLVSGFYAPPSLRQPLTVACVLAALVSANFIAARARRRSREEAQAADSAER